MVLKAEALGADAVVGLRFSTSSIAQGASELFVYGTAVKAVRLQNQPAHNQPFQNQPPNGQSDHNQTPAAELPRFNPFG
jgi:hypothetical protein